MASQSIQALVQRAESARRTLSNYRDRARVNERRMISKAEVALGGVIGGAIDGKMGEAGEDYEILGMPGVPLLGGAMVLVGLSDAVPGAEDVASVGAGMLAYSLGGITRGKLSEE